MYLNYFADSGTFWNIIRLLQNTCSYLQVPSGLCYNVWVTCLTLSPHLAWPSTTPLGVPMSKTWCDTLSSEHGVATRPLSTFKQLLALTEKCIFRGEKETFRDWINHNWLYGILMVPDNSVYVSWTNPRPGLQNRFSDFVKNCDFICSNIYTCPI